MMCDVAGQVNPNSNGDEGGLLAVFDLLLAKYDSYIGLLNANKMMIEHRIKQEFGQRTTMLHFISQKLSENEGKVVSNKMMARLTKQESNYQTKMLHQLNNKYCEHISLINKEKMIFIGIIIEKELSIKNENFYVTMGQLFEKILTNGNSESKSILFKFLIPNISCLYGLQQHGSHGDNNENKKWNNNNYNNNDSNSCNINNSYNINGNINDLHGFDETILENKYQMSHRILNEICTNKTVNDNNRCPFVNNNNNNNDNLCKAINNNNNGNSSSNCNSINDDFDFDFDFDSDMPSL